MAKKKKNKKRKSKKIGFKGFFLGFFTILAMVIFTPTTAILLVGMLPTFVAYLVDRSLEKNKTFTIGAMNFAGCFPYLLGLWTGENTLQVALNYLENPQTIIVIYAIAAMGYIINYMVTLGVSSILVQKSKMRIEKIDKEKQSLKDRWGEKVNGKYDLDEHGFPIQGADEEVSSAS
jgi:uncharacterized membrane protein YiaA